MNDFMRESLSYFGLYWRMFQVKKKYRPEMVPYGNNKDQYFLYYEPQKALSDKIIVWVHGGGWNAGNPKFFDYVGQCVCDQGYRFVSLGYRLSPKYKYPCQIKDVCAAYNSAMSYLKEKGTDISKVIVAGPSAGAHLTSLMCYCRKIQKKYNVDVSNVIGFIGSGGPYTFREALMGKSHIPMLLIQSRHDGLIEYACAEDFARRAEELGNTCELYSIEDKKNTHSWYTAGMFLESREENKGLDKFFSWIEEL